MQPPFPLGNFHRTFGIISNGVARARNPPGFSSGFPDHVPCSRRFSTCTISVASSAPVKYLNARFSGLSRPFALHRTRFFSTAPGPQDAPATPIPGEEAAQNTLLNAAKAYKKDDRQDLADMADGLGLESELAVKKLDAAELFAIPDYHEYLLARIADANGVKRSLLQNVLPVDHVQQLFVLVHDYTHLSWSATICLMTLFFKVLSLPVWCAAERSRRRNAYLIPKATELQERARHALETKDYQLARETQLKIYEITKDNAFLRGVLVQTAGAAFQGLMFGTVYGGLRLFAINPQLRPDFTFEPCLWLDSLCLPDPYFVLPCIFGVLMTLVFEHSLAMNYVPRGATAAAAGGAAGPAAKLESRQKYMKLAYRAGIVFFTLYGFTMPSSAFFYLIPSFLFQTVLRYACNRFLVSRLLGVPLPIVRRDKRS